jgi:hypothetical protein
MKKLFILSAATFILIATINAQASQVSPEKSSNDQKKEALISKKKKPAETEELKKLKGAEVSPLAKQEFYQIYGNIPGAVWKRTLNYDQVFFSRDGKAMTAYYDADAKLVGTITQQKFEDLPSDSQKYINEKYPGYITEDVVFFNDNELNITDIVLFNKQFDEEDCYYVKMKKDNQEILVKVKMSGDISSLKLK